MTKLPKNWLSRAKLRELLFVRYRFWVILLTLFCASQVINIWAEMPDYGAWDVVFGFPFAYLLWKNTDGFVYFNLIILIVDLLIVYLAFRTFLYARWQIYHKYEIPKSLKEQGEKEKKERELQKKREEGRK